MRVLVTTVVVLTFICCNQREENNSVQLIKSKDSDVEFMVIYGETGSVRSVLVRNLYSKETVDIQFDSIKNVRGIGLKKSRKRTHSVEYFDNGRPMGLTNFDSTGSGDAIYYYENGNKKSEGRWDQWQQIGVWKNYDSSGKLLGADSMATSG